MKISTLFRQSMDFFLGPLAKLRIATVSFVMYVCMSVRSFVRSSVRLHGAIQLPTDKFLRSLIYDYFSKISREISSSIKIRQKQRVLYLKADAHL